MSEHTNECKNGYTTSNEFFESYGDEDSVNNCEGCPNFSYKNGICSCEKFNSNRGE